MVRSQIGWVVATCVLVVFLALPAGQARAEGLPEDPIAAAGAAAKAPENPDVTAAMELFRKGDIQGGYERLKVAVQKDAKLPSAELILAQIALANKDFAGLREWSNKAVAEHPDDPEAYAFLGQIAMAEQRVPEAGLLAEKAKSLLASFKGDAQRKTRVTTVIEDLSAKLAMRRSDWATAQAHLETLAAAQPNNTQLLVSLARVMFEQKKMDEAMEKLRAAKKADAKVLTPEAVLGQWHEGAGDRAKATEMFTKALELAPHDVNTRLAAASWALRIGEMETARQQAELAVKEDAKSLPAKLVAGDVALFQGDYASAEKYFLDALSLSPGDFHASNNLALALCEQADESKRQQAKSYAEMGVKLNQNTNNTAEALSTLGRVYFKLNLLGDAERAFMQSAKTAGAFKPDTAYYFADLLVKAGKKEDAKRLLEGALKSKAPFAEKPKAQALLQQVSQ